MTEQILINRQQIYLTIDNVKLKTDNGLEEQENQFIGYFKNDPPNEISFGEQIKNTKGENVIFHSVDQARNEISEMLKRKIYPPSFFNPMEYTAENLPEIMHKELWFGVGDFDSDEIKESFQGKIINCNLASASVPSNMPYSVRLITDRGERSLRIEKLKRIRR